MPVGQDIGALFSQMGPGLLSGLGKMLEHQGQQQQQGPHDHAQPDNYDHGGMVHKSGMAMVHKGETVIPAKHNVSLYRAMHHLRHGGLHRALGIPEGESIPQDKLEAAKHSDNTHVSHMAHFAATMEGFHH